MLPSGNFTFNDIHMVIPSGTTSTSLNSLISQGKWGDDDGDGQGAGGVTASGSISLVIKDRDGATVSRNDTLSICNAPYKVTLDSTEGTLETRYGMPRSSLFHSGTVDYYITTPQPVICSVRPNLLLGGTSDIPSHDNPRYAGPANIWSSTKGFLVQSTNPSSYELNFPTTGADGLYFDLLIGGVDGSQLTWSPVTHGGITATVTSVAANDSWIPGVDRGKVVARVTLSGPRADSTQLNSSNPSPLTSPSLPQDFELVGSDGRGNEVRYGFVLRQWFVNRGLQTASASNQTAWCNSLGYRMPRVRDLTNAVCSGWNSGRYCRGTVGATPSSGNNVFRRHIGAGFFTEWGYMSNYADVGFVSFNYWTSDVVGGNGVYVYTYDGSVFTDNVSYSGYAVCTAP
ncbi:hypothetical protein A9G31_11210 [Gilliamella sp. Gris1-4]|nr:hypothetical protein A9G31_11210 [Gilliamella apicola]